MIAIDQNKKSKVCKGREDRQVRRLATVFMSLAIVLALLATGCSNFGSGQTQTTKVKPVVGSTRQDHALKVRIDNLCWSWKSETTPIKGETGAFSIEVEATVKNTGKCKLHSPSFSVDGGGSVLWYQASREDLVRGNVTKLRIVNRNQVHLEFNNNDPGEEIFFTVHATDQWGELYSVRFTLPPPLDMPRCIE